MHSRKNTDGTHSPSYTMLRETSSFIPQSGSFAAPENLSIRELRFLTGSGQDLIDKKNFIGIINSSFQYEK
jgi:hypothetical protein